LPARNSLFIIVTCIFLSRPLFPQTETAVRPLWRGALGGAVLCPPSCKDGVIIAVCDGGFLRAFSYEGRDLWTYRIRGRFAPFIVRGADGVSWAALEEAGGSATLIALNRWGRKISELRFDKPFTGVPEAGLDGRIFVPFGDTVATYTLFGRKLGESKAGASSYNGFAPLRPAVYPQVTLTTTRAEKRSPDGGLQWAIDLTGAAALPAYNGEGLVVVGGRNWLLAAYRMEDSLPSPPKPPETYGLARVSPVPGWVSLEIIEESLRTGSVGVNERVFVSYLMQESRVTPNKRLLAQTIAGRTAALFLLGELGSAEYVPFLLDVFRREKNDLVKAAAARAIGAIGVDRTGRVMDVFTAEILPVTSSRSEPVMAAVAETAGRLSIVTGAPVYERSLFLLGALAAQRQFPGIQKIASRRLDQIFAR
jgi:hypothetical protein